MFMPDFGVITAVFLTLCVYSFVYRESMFWRFAERTFVGLALGYSAVLAIKNVIAVTWIPISNGSDYLLIVSILLGFVIYTRFSKKYGWVSRWPMAIVVGVGVGLTVRTIVQAQIVSQLTATFLSLLSTDPLQTVNNIAIVAMVIASLYFFTYTGGKNKVSNSVRTFGRYALMVAFGSAFGGAVLTRMSLLIGREAYLWDPSNRYYLIPIGIAMLIFLLGYDRFATLLARK